MVRGPKNNSQKRVCKYLKQQWLTGVTLLPFLLVIGAWTDMTKLQNLSASTQWKFIHCHTTRQRRHSSSVDSSPCSDSGTQPLLSWSTGSLRAWVPWIQLPGEEKGGSSTFAASQLVLELTHSLHSPCIWRNLLFHFTQKWRSLGNF